jgi:hypothetical protein
MRFPAIDRQQVMNGGRTIQHANSIAELIDEFFVYSIGNVKGKNVCVCEREKKKMIITTPLRFQLHKSR